jgi:hypothetical protein
MPVAHLAHKAFKTNSQNPKRPKKRQLYWINKPLHSLNTPGAPVDFAA